MVGIGRLSIYPITKDDIRQGNYPGMDEPFKSMSCSEHGSQIPNVETLIKNVTDSLLDSWNSKLSNSLPNNSIEKTEESGMNSQKILTNFSFRMCCSFLLIFHFRILKYFFLELG